MNILSEGMIELIGGLIAFLLTLMILSYLLGDNPFFRFATHLFIGVTAGYVAVVALYNVILPQLLFPFLDGSHNLTTYLMLIASILLLFKLSPRLSRVGNGIMAFLVGVGAAVAIGGAILGTIFPQIGASVQLFDAQQMTFGLTGSVGRMISAGVILVGTLTTFLYFHFGRPDRQRGKQQAAWLEGIGYTGQIFIAITFGVLFAGTYFSAIVALIERITFVREFLGGLFGLLLS